MLVGRYAAKGDWRDEPLDHQACADQVRGSVLEVGCAFGAFAAYLPAKTQYVGIDISATAVEFARLRMPERVFLRAEALSLGSEFTKAFDTVVAGQFLEHFAEPREVLRVLRLYARERVVLTLPRGKPSDEQRINDGHLSGWVGKEDVRQSLGSTGRLAISFFDVHPDHIGCVVTWRKTPGYPGGQGDE